MAACATCNSDERAALESAGLDAMRGKRSWRSIATEFSLPHHAGVKRHMEGHFQATTPEPTPSTLDPLIEEAVEALTEQCRVAPADLKPLYLSAIHNLRGLASTQPSQQHLQAALKSIHEITGMKMDQQLMLRYAMNRFQKNLEPSEDRPKLDRFAGAIEVEVDER